MALRSRGKESRSLGDLAELLGGELLGDAGRRVTGVAEPGQAGSCDLIFCSDSARAAELRTTQAAAVLLPPDLEPEHLAPGLAVIRVADPYLAVARVLEVLYPGLPVAAVGIHPSASVAEDAVLDDGVGIGAQAVVSAGAHIGPSCQVGPGCVIGSGVSLGPACVLHANVCLYAGTRLGARVILHAGVVVGADGFGYARDGARRVKVPQIGGVTIEDDVEVGANACIDRGTLHDTRIGHGSKIDNLVQIGHNCDIGAHCAISGLAGLSGSTVLEDGVILGGNVGTAGHQVIGSGSIVAAKSGVHGDVPANSVVGGYPQLDVRVWRRVVAALPKLPEIIRRVRRLERASKSSQE